MPKRGTTVHFEEFVAAFSMYVRVNEDQTIHDTRPNLVDGLLDLVTQSGVEELREFEVTDLAAMVSGHIKYDKETAILVAVPNTPGSEQMLKAISESGLGQKILTILALAANDVRVSSQLPLVKKG